MSERKPSRRGFLKAAALAPVMAQLATARRALGDELAGLGERTAAQGLGASLASSYRLDPSITYLNHGSIGTIPRAIQQAHRKYLEICETNPWVHMWGEAWKEPLQQVRNQAASMLCCDASEVAFTHNTTEAFNLLANGLPLAAGDEVLFSSLNHTGASACWHHMAEVRGFTVREFDFPLREVPHLTADDVVGIYREQIRPETRVLVFTHVDNQVGLRHPVKELAAAARERGVQFVAVDAAQTVGMIPLDVAAMGVDVYATSPHKWLQAPKGLGLVYVRQEIQDNLRPMWVTWGQARYRGTARIYEDYGTRNLPEVLSLGDAIDFQQQLDESNKEHHHRRLWEAARSAVAESPRLRWRSPTTWRLSAALYSIEPIGESSRAVFERLYSRHGYVFRPFEIEGLNAVRLSPNVMNTRGQIAEVLAKVAEKG
ncbi:MAG: aminotransferase class V-fold PLP-dependent enzyme [Acidobacteriota bacterium]